MGNETSSADSTEQPPPAAPRARQVQRLVLAVLWTVGLAALAAADVPGWSGPVLSALCVVLAGAGTWLALPSVSGSATAAAYESDPSAVAFAPGSDTELTRQVVPVWQRSVEAARTHSEQEAGTLLESFARVSSHLDLAMAGTRDAPLLEIGAVDDLIERHRTEIDQVQADARQALNLVQHMLAQLKAMGGTVDQLVVLSNQVQAIARATHMLSLNASVEATRAGASGAGFAVVARDVGDLASQSRQAAQQMASHVQRVREAIVEMQSSRQNFDLDDEDLSMRTETHARAAVRALMSSLGDSARNSRTLRDAGRQAQTDIDNILMSLQAQDRLSQMLQSVTEDMARMERWLKGEPDEAAQSPSAWLGRLESSYTMEDMRSAHHGTSQIEQQAAVEFF
jgi:methyl-accepting chemotaxis protein